MRKNWSWREQSPIIFFCLEPVIILSVSYWFPVSLTLFLCQLWKWFQLHRGALPGHLHSHWVRSLNIRAGGGVLLQVGYREIHQQNLGLTTWSARSTVDLQLEHKLSRVHTGVFFYFFFLSEPSGWALPLCQCSDLIKMDEWLAMFSNFFFFHKALMLAWTQA